MKMYTTDYWCLECPTRIRVVSNVKNIEPRFSTDCPMCPSTLWDTQSLMNGDYSNYDGEDFVLRKHTESEVEKLHKELREFSRKSERAYAKDSYEREVAAAKEKLNKTKRKYTKKGPNR